MENRDIKTFLRDHAASCMIFLLIFVSSAPAVGNGAGTYFGTAGLLLSGTLLTYLFSPGPGIKRFPYLTFGEALRFSAVSACASSALAFALGAGRRKEVLLSSALLIALVTVSAFISSKTAGKLRRKKTAVVIVKRGEAREALDILSEEYDIDGFITTDTGIVGESEAGARLLGVFRDALPIIGAVSPDEVFIIPGKDEDPPSGFIGKVLASGIPVSVMTPDYSQDKKVSGTLFTVGNMTAVKLGTGYDCPLKKAVQMMMRKA